MMENVGTEKKSVLIMSGKRKAADAINTVGEKQLLSDNRTQDLLNELIKYEHVNQMSSKTSQRLLSSNSSSDGRTSVETVSSSDEKDHKPSYTSLRPNLLDLTKHSEANCDSEAEFDFDSPEDPFSTTPLNTFKTNLFAIGVPESDIDYDLFSTLKDMGFVLPSGELNEGVNLRDVLSMIRENFQTRKGRLGRGKRDTFTPTGSTSKTSGFATNKDRELISICVKKLKK